MGQKGEWGGIRMGRDPGSIHPGKEGTRLPSSELELLCTERGDLGCSWLCGAEGGKATGRSSQPGQRLG